MAITMPGQKGYPLRSELADTHRRRAAAPRRFNDLAGINDEPGKIAQTTAADDAQHVKDCDLSRLQAAQVLRKSSPDLGMLKTQLDRGLQVSEL